MGVRRMSVATRRSIAAIAILVRCLTRRPLLSRRRHQALYLTIHISMDTRSGDYKAPRFTVPAVR